MIITDIEFEHYAKLFLDLIPRARQTDKDTCVGRCVICGDSKKNPSKTRLYLLRANGNKPTILTCHNCGESITAINFFKKYYSKEISEFLNGWGDRSLESIKKVINGEERIQFEKVKEPSGFEKLKLFSEDLAKSKFKVHDFLVRYTDNIQTLQEAVDYMRGRNVPEDIIKNMRVIKNSCYNSKVFKYSYLKDYVLMPFIDNSDKKAYFFQSRRFRKFTSNMCPYLMCHVRPESFYTNYYYNDLNVRSDQPVVIVEGTLDSFHIPNSISVNGIKKITEESIEYFENKYGADNVIFAVDNEMIDNDSKIKTKFLLERHKCVFLWGLMNKVNPNVANIKDFNELCCKSNRQYIPIEVIQKFSTKSLSSLLE